VPTTNRDFRVKNGLVVEGATATVNGSNVVTESSTSTLTNKTLTSPILTTPSIGAASGTSLSLTTALSATSGGTGQATYTTGDILIASATNTLSKLAAVTSGYVLTSNGVGTAPSWQVSGGGTSLPTQTGNAGRLLTTDGTSASWSNTLIANATTSVGLVVRGLASQTADLLQVQNSAASSLVTVSSAGLVGIGMVPTRQLSIFQDTTPVLQLTNTASGTTSADGGLIYLAGDQLSFRAAESTGALSFQTAGANVRMFIDSTGKIGAGMSSPATQLDVLGAQVLNRGVLQVIDSTAQAAGTGAGITLGGVFNSGGSVTPAVQIKASKTNATSGNYAFDMVFLSYNNGDLNMTERMRINSAGNVGIGVTNNDYSAYGGRLAIVNSGQASMFMWSSGVGSGHIGFPGSSSTMRVVNTFADGLIANGVGIDITTAGNVGIGTSTPSSKLTVIGSFSATTKSFDIEHPTKPDMRLRYGSLEGPENGVYIRGKSKNKTIQLPDYWTGLVHEDSITVNLTSIGSGTIYVEEVVDNTVKVGGTSKEFFFTIYGERKDVDKLTVEY
jgi:hypothetical protein